MFFILGFLKVKLILENVINVNILGILCFMGSVWVFVNALAFNNVLTLGKTLIKTFKKQLLQVFLYLSEIVLYLNT